MRVSGFMILKDGVAQGYPFVEAAVFSNYPLKQSPNLESFRDGRVE